MNRVIIVLTLLGVIAPTFGAPPTSNQGDFKKVLSFKNNGDKQGPTALAWWQESVIYQIYPRSFQDSDGDGVGDIKGITSRLDYFVDLGVEAIWISPIYKSPMKDFGYDISNFTDIEPVFGTLEDFREMSQAFRDRGLKLIMDFVPNHSSDMHEWFQKSIQKVEPYTDYYVWKDPISFGDDGKPIPPNNWTSVFGGSMWEWNNERQQFYLHQFVKEQPDLNFENPLVWSEILGVVKFWLDMGVDGFRVDAVPHMFEDQMFLDEPVDPNRDPEARPDEHRYYLHPYTINLPKVLDFLADFRKLMDIYTAVDGQVRCLMVEAAIDVSLLMDYYGNSTRPIAHFPFNFNLLGVQQDYNGKQVLDLLNIWNEYMPQGQWATILIGNHDNKRAPTRFTKEAMDAANMINLLYKGTAVTYYGEEIGMEDTWISWEDTVDPAGCNMGEDRYEQFSRDPARTPMQWSDSQNAGFSTGNRTWLPINENYMTINVETENSVNTEESNLKVYKDIIKLRKTDTWRYGEYESMALNNDNVLGFTRIAPASIDPTAFLVLANFGTSSVTVDATVFAGVPSTARVNIRSVNFESRNTTVGLSISTRTVPLGPKNSIVLTFGSSL